MAEGRRVTAVVGMGGEYLGTAGPFDVPGPWWSHVEEVTRRLDEELGVPTAVVRLLSAANAELGRAGRVTYHVEALRRPTAGVLEPGEPERWPAVLAGHPLRAWWARPSGPCELVDWALDAVGARLTGRPVQVKTWNLSCLYRLPTSNGTLWAKALNSFAGHEAASIGLARRYDCGIAPQVLADDPARRRMVLRHAGGTDCWDAEADVLCDLVRRWVAVQAAADPGITPGLRDRRPVTLLDDVPRLLRGDLGDKLDGEELAAADALVARLPAVIDELESSCLPHTLVHGDLHQGNMLSDGSTSTLVDWAESHLGHPAFDIAYLLRWTPADHRGAVEAAWTGAWLEHRPASDPRRALRPMGLLALLLNAVLYQRFLDNIEPSERVYHEGDPAGELRRALRSAQGDAVSLRV